MEQIVLIGNPSQKGLSSSLVSIYEPDGQELSVKWDDTILLPRLLRAHKTDKQRLRTKLDLSKHNSNVLRTHTGDYIIRTPLAVSNGMQNVRFSRMGTNGSKTASQQDDLWVGVGVHKPINPRSSKAFVRTKIKKTQTQVEVVESAIDDEDNYALKENRRVMEYNKLMDSRSKQIKIKQLKQVEEKSRRNKGELN